LKYGLIPEFVGRLPVVATLEDLDEASLKKDPDRSEERAGEAIPAAVRDGEYRAHFSPTRRLARVARRAIERKTRRAQRDCVRSSRASCSRPCSTFRAWEGVEEVVISREVVEGTARPLYIYADRSDPRRRGAAPAPDGALRPGSSFRIPKVTAAGASGRPAVA